MSRTIERLRRAFPGKWVYDRHRRQWRTRGFSVCRNGDLLTAIVEATWS